MEEKINTEKFQVNISENVYGDSTAWVSKYNPNGYVGILIDTQYIDGADKTNWCVYSGSKEDCDKYALKLNNKIN